MKWFWRQNKTVEVPPELKPYYEQPSGSSSALRLWLLVLAAVVVLAGIGVAVYFLGPWSSSDNQTRSGGQQTATNHSKTTVPKPSPSGDSSSSGDSSAAHSQTPNKTSGSDKATVAPPANRSGTSAGAQTPKSGSQVIANTGPGDTVTMFVGAVLVGSLGYHLLQRRHLRS